MFFLHTDRKIRAANAGEATFALSPHLNNNGILPGKYQSTADTRLQLWNFPCIITFVCLYLKYANSLPAESGMNRQGEIYFGTPASHLFTLINLSRKKFT
jgi:hypothetical protein